MWRRGVFRLHRRAKASHSVVLRCWLSNKMNPSSPLFPSPAPRLILFLHLWYYCVFFPPPLSPPPPPWCLSSLICSHKRFEAYWGFGKVLQEIQPLVSWLFIHEGGRSVWQHEHQQRWNVLKRKTPKSLLTLLLFSAAWLKNNLTYTQTVILGYKPWSVAIYTQMILYDSHQIWTTRKRFVIWNVWLNFLKKACRYIYTNMLCY